MYHIYWTLQKFWKERYRDWWKITITCVKLHELISVCHYAKTNLKPQNFTFIIYNFQGRILRGDAHSKHILIILVIDSWNFRQFQEWFSEFQWDEDRKQNRKSNSSNDKKGRILAWSAWSLRIPHHGLGFLQMK